MTPVALCLEELLPADPDSFKGRTASLFIRTALVASTIVVATMVPFFGFVMAFIGAFMSMTVRFTCGLIILLGVICAIAGTYSSAAAIIKSFLVT